MKSPVKGDIMKVTIDHAWCWLSKYLWTSILFRTIL